MESLITSSVKLISPAIPIRPHIRILPKQRIHAHPPSQTRVQQTVLRGIDALGKVALLLVAGVAETVGGHEHGGMGYEALHDCKLNLISLT